MAKITDFQQFCFAVLIYLAEIILIIMLSFSMIEAVNMNKTFVKRLSTDENREEMFLKNRNQSSWERSNY